MKSDRIDSLVFDLDGTLWDASSACAKAWNEAVKQTGFEKYVFDEEWVRSVSGLRIETIFEEHLTTIPKEKHEELLACYRKKEVIYMKEFGGQLYPHAKEVLSELKKNYKLFVVSNCSSGYIENFIAFHDLADLFTDFECSGNTGLQKSENIKLVMERNRLQGPVYIGDTIWDQEAAQKAALPFIHAAYGFGDVAETEQKIEKLSDLPELLSRLSYS